MDQFVQWDVGIAGREGSRSGAGLGVWNNAGENWMMEIMEIMGIRENGTPSNSRGRSINLNFLHLEI